MNFNKQEFEAQMAQLDAELEASQVEFNNRVVREYGITAQELRAINVEFLGEVKEQMRQEKLEAEALYRNSIIDDPIAMFVHSYE